MKTFRLPHGHKLILLWFRFDFFGLLWLYFLGISLMVTPGSLTWNHTSIILNGIWYLILSGWLVWFWDHLYDIHLVLKLSCWWVHNMDLRFGTSIFMLLGALYEFSFGTLVGMFLVAWVGNFLETSIGYLIFNTIGCPYLNNMQCKKNS